ncbi:MAG: hypothetical protein I3275_04635 [Candidatus Moeniiplasma glomeromycotorum]|nr:hypothetical protein [Candidatus Moeniiplasma glomeromycotorum]
MNQITPKILTSELKEFEKSLLQKQKATNLEFFRTQTTNLLKNLPKGVDKSELLTLLEEIFGQKNFQNGKYKGGKEVIVETIHEFFGKENFSNGKFTGGWNEKQDQEALQKSLQPFKNWTETQAETKKQAQQLIETKLGGSDNFKDGIYQIEKKITQTNLKELKPGGAILNELHDIFGPDKFYSQEPGENIPSGREGKYKDDREIALLQAKYQAEIKATEDWLKFFKKHLITSDKETLWRDKFGSNVDGAEDLYEDAKSKGQEILGEDFNDTEKRRIEKEAHSPEEIQKVLAEIPQIRKKLAWDKFFRECEADGRIRKEWEENWRNSQLSIPLAEKIYQNGWNNSPNGLINQEKIIENYTTEILVKGQKYEKSTKNINPLKHLAEEVDSAHEFIVKEIDLQTDLNKFPTNEIIEGVYNEKKVPDTINHEELQNLRDNRIKTLFKEYFQGQNPTKLSDQEIEKWRLVGNGLPNTGKDQRIAYENGWSVPSEIKDGKTTYQGITEIEVLKIKKADIDQEITKVNNLVQQINSYKFLRDLDANQSAIDKQFSELKTNLLPPNKSNEITKAVEKQRQNLFYSLIDPQDGGLPEETLKKLTQNLQNTWNVPNYEPMTVKRLNDFIAADKDVQALGLFKSDQKWEDLNTPNEKLYGLNEKGQPHSWLSKQGGYELPKEKTTAEDKLHISQKGAYLLDFFYKKSKDGKGYPFNPDKLTDPNIHFCQIGTKMVKKFKKKMMGRGEWIEEPTEVIGGDKGNSGHLAIGTGIGKTTKLINCLVKGGERNVILVCPTQGLVESAFKHHTGWLQPWGCVWHGGIKGETEMAYTLRGNPTQRATEEEIKEGKHDPEMKSLYKSHGSYPVAKNDLAYWLNANTGQKEGLEPGKKGLSIMYFGNLLGFASRNLFVESGGINSWTDENLKSKVKEKLIPKDDTIIVFDEAHFNDAGYQALQFEMIKAGYNCLRMSATFPGAEFSTTSSFSMKRVSAGKLEQNMPGHLMVYQNSEQVEQLEQLRGVPVGSIKWKDENGSPIPIEVNLDERLQTGNTWIFGKNLELSEEQVRALGSNVSYMVYTPEFDENCEDISFGRPQGSADNVDGSKEMGYTPFIHTVICLGATETTNLQKFFTYSEPTLGFTQISSLMQQMGRVSRITYGLAITLTKECGEIDLSDNVSAAMVKANFDGNIKQINDKEYKQIYDIDILRGALSYPDPKTFGKAPEEILMGLKITKDQQNKKEKLSQLVWRQDNDTDKAEALAKPWYAFMASDINPSEKLWNKYLGKSDKITMGEETAKNLLKEMISNFIVQNKKYPQGLDLKNQAKFIGSVFGEKLDSNKKEEVIKETRTVLNGLVESKINELASKDYDETNKRSKNPNTIKKLAGLYKLTDAEIDYQKEKNSEGKLVWTLRINA